MKNTNSIQQKTLIPLPKKEIKPNTYHGFELKMVKDFHFDECASALQKSIRRGLEFESCYWAGLFFRSGYSRYLAKRLKVIMEEDIGPANTTCLLLSNQIFLETQAKDYKSEQSNDGFLKYVNLIILACRSKKTRIADELGNVILDSIDKLDIRLKLDDDYLDPHTTIGKIQHGRWDDNEHKGKALERIKNWFQKWSFLDNQDESFNQYRNINETIWKFTHLTKKEKDNLIHVIINLISKKREKIHQKIKEKSNLL